MFSTEHDADMIKLQQVLDRIDVQERVARKREAKRKAVLLNASTD